MSYSKCMLGIPTLICRSIVEAENQGVDLLIPKVLCIQGFLEKAVGLVQIAEIFVTKQHGVPNSNGKVLSHCQ